MRFKIPFTIASIDKSKKRSEYFQKYVHYKRNSKLKNYLENCDVDITREQYLAICYRSLISVFVGFFLVSSTTLFLAKVQSWLLYSFLLSLVFAGFVFFSQIMYPKVFTNKKQREIERNLISALQNMLVQLNSGVPLFGALVNISSSDYGALSNEFKKAVKKISAGLPQMDVLEEIGEKNPSPFFRRTLWQISNGMRAGSDLSAVIKDNIRALTDDQIIQIQNYGNKLNPLIMFYMLVSVILPSLAITFLTVLSSLVNLSSMVTMLLFASLFVGVVFIQIMFLGIIKSVRPSLL